MIFFFFYMKNLVNFYLFNSLFIIFLKNLTFNYFKHEYLYLINFFGKILLYIFINKISIKFKYILKYLKFIYIEFFIFQKNLSKFKNIFFFFKKKNIFINNNLRIIFFEILQKFIKLGIYYKKKLFFKLFNNFFKIDMFNMSNKKLEKKILIKNEFFFFNNFNIL